MNFRVSQHALYRYMMRVLNYDFTELRILYMLERGFPSLNHIRDGEFMAWCEDEINGMEEFRAKITEHVWNLMDEVQKRLAVHNKHYEGRVADLDNRITFVVRDDTIVTVLNGARN